MEAVKFIGSLLEPHLSSLTYFIFGGVFAYFFFNAFLLWLDKILFGKSQVLIIQDKIKITDPVGVNSMPGGFHIHLMVNKDDRFLIHRDVRHGKEALKGTLRFNTGIVGSLKADEEYYSIILRNASNRRRLKNPLVKLNSRGGIAFNGIGSNEVVDVNCAGFDTNDFCQVKIANLKAGHEAAFNLNGKNIDIPEYSDESRVKAEITLKTYESHITILSNENTIVLGGEVVSLPETNNEEISLYMLYRNPTEWIPLNVKDKSNNK